MKRFVLLLGTLVLVACSRSTVAGYYETEGTTQADAAKFQMALELNADGGAKLVTRSNMGNPAMDQKVAQVLSIPAGRWTQQNKEVTVAGPRAADGKASAHQFALDQNGDLIWKENGARFHKKR